MELNEFVRCVLMHVHLIKRCWYFFIRKCLRWQSSSNTHRNGNNMAKTNKQMEKKKFATKHTYVSNALLNGIISPSFEALPPPLPPAAVAAAHNFLCTSNSIFVFNKRYGSIFCLRFLFSSSSNLCENIYLLCCYGGSCCFCPYFNGILSIYYFTFVPCAKSGSVSFVLQIEFWFIVIRNIILSILCSSNDVSPSWKIIMKKN